KPKTKVLRPKTIHAMKRCPTCNQTIEEDWLSFCTDDGTSLVDFTPSSHEPSPTIRVTAADTNPLGKPTFDLPGSYTPATLQFEQPKTPAPLWQPPPPMAFSPSPQQGLALTSMILGVVSITIGWCCYFGVITAPISIIMGAISLRSEEHTSELQSRENLVCRLLLEKKKKKIRQNHSNI